MDGLKIVGCRQNEGHFFGGLSSGKRFFPKGRLRTVFLKSQNGWHRPLECPKRPSYLRYAGLSLVDCGYIYGGGKFFVKKFL